MPKTKRYYGTIKKVGDAWQWRYGTGAGRSKKLRSKEAAEAYAEEWSRGHDEDARRRSKMSDPELRQQMQLEITVDSLLEQYGKDLVDGLILNKNGHEFNLKSINRLKTQITWWREQLRVYRSDRDGGLVPYKHPLRIKDLDVDPMILTSIINDTRRGMRLVPSGKRSRPAEGTLANMWRAMSSILSWAIRDGGFGLKQNPMIGGLTRVAAIKPAKRQAVHDEDVVKAVLDATRRSDEPRLYAMAQTAHLAGLRRGEVERLRWADVIAPQGEMLAQLAIMNSKGQKSRTVMISNALFEILEGERRRQRHWFRNVEFVFENEDGFHGFPNRAWSLATEVADARLRADGHRGILQTDEIKPGEFAGFWFHDWRAQFARSWLQTNVSITMLSRYLGHADTKVTEAHYGFLIEQDVHRAAAEVFRKQSELGLI